MWRYARVLGLVVLPGLHGCGEPRADTSTPDAASGSLSAMYEVLPAARHDALRWAVEVVASDELNERVRLTAIGKAGDMDRPYPSKLDGKTAQQIITLAQDRCAREDRDYPICNPPFLPD